jgi:hypothetical protein
MRSVARLATAASAFALGACAVIAGLDDPKAVDDATSGSSTSSGSVQDTGNTSSSGSAASDSSTDGASSSGAPADAQPDVPACALLANGQMCSAHVQCCSSKCNENRQCTSDCKNLGMFNCDPTSDDDCCLGLYCNTGSCTQCVLAGQPPADGIGGFPNPRSCCGRSINIGTGMCN